ncbi:glycosyltransferase 87 family protein [Miltoncostaea marina]|uniref:glycosyltransferase 87 family protein n=1 Tax=Miltoncostaea marina TaxID=2843215 RepID=UPI001C3DC537|nr:glycosyltransferase 87 family protein [Miltoncostaea marina]
MSWARALPAAACALAAVVWAVPLRLGVYADAVITDIPVYRRVYEHIAAGHVPYADFSLEYPPLAGALFWAAGALPGPYGVTFSVLMLLALCATVLGVIALARATGLDGRRQTVAAALVAVSPLLLGNLVETRFDLALAALLVWTVWAAATERWRLAWGLLAAATLLKLIPLALIPVLVIWQRHRAGTRPAIAGAVGSVAAVALVMAPFAALSPSGTWDLARYHLERPLQIEATASAYLLGLHGLADIDLSVEHSFGSQGLSGTGPAILAGASTVALVVLLVAIAWTLWLGLHRARHPGDARLLVAACAATLVALLVCGKVLSPQFLVWLLPVCFIVAGRYGPAAMALTAAALLLTFAYFPHRYWDLVALEGLPIAILVLRDSVLIALLAACWPRPSLAGRPLGRVLGRERDPMRPEGAVSARYLVD